MGKNALFVAPVARVQQFEAYCGQLFLAIPTCNWGAQGAWLSTPPFITDLLYDEELNTRTYTQL